MVTIKDIAREVGVSPSTVSRALSNSPLISEETKQNVKEVAQKLGYERNELARSLVKGSSRTVGLVIPDITNPFFADIARGVAGVAHSLDFGVILCNTEEESERESAYLRLLRQKRVDGLVLTSVTTEDPSLEELLQAGIPFILVSRLSKDAEAPYVVGDDRKGARLAVEHLVGLGHKQIGFIGGPADVISSTDRLEEYRRVLKEHSLLDRKEWFCYSDFTRTAGCVAGRRMLSLPNRPTAIFAANDVTALGVMEAAEQLGLKLPRDLSLVGYDDISYASLPRIQLTTVAQPAVEMGEIAAQWLIEVVEGKHPGTLQYLVDPQLVVRETTAQPQ